jgi:hypothetical protein
VASARAALEQVEIEHLAEDRCRVRVTLARQLGLRLRQSYVGRAEGDWSPLGELRCTAQAALLALERTFAAPAETFALLDIKTVESFDCPGVIVAIGARFGDATQRLVGFCEVADDPRAAAAKAALNATNRFVGYRLASGDERS